MTYRLHWVLGLGVVAVAGGCSSTSGTPLHTSEDASSEDDASSSATDGGGTPPMDAPASTTCDAVSLAAPPDAGAAACFTCLAGSCMSQIASCSTDCACAPAFACLQQNSTGDSLNSGFSACPAAVNAIMNGNAATTALTQCATMNCNAQCYGGAADGG